jgi:hypothetical protein
VRPTLLKRWLFRAYAHLLRAGIHTVHWHGERLANLEMHLHAALPYMDKALVVLPGSQRSVALKVGGDLGKTVFLDGLLGYEESTTRVWHEFCKQADIVLDIGAHVGLFALLAADANPGCEVYAFEPLPVNYDLLCANIEAGEMDVETHEPEVLRGAQTALTRGPALFCEVLATFVEVELNGLLPPSRWRYFWIGPDGPTEHRRIVGDPAWEHMNYIFLTHDSPYLSLVGG